MGQPVRRVQQVAEARRPVERGRLGHGPEPPEQVVQRRENVNGAAESIDGRRLRDATEQRLDPVAPRRLGRITLEARRRGIVEAAAPLPEVIRDVEGCVVRPSVPAWM